MTTTIEPASSPDAPGVVPAVSGRRRFLHTLGTAAAAGAGMAVAGGALNPAPAGAANGDAVILGTSNSATSATFLNCDFGNYTALYAQNFGSDNGAGTTRAIQAVAVGYGVLGIGEVKAGVIGLFPRGSTASDSQIDRCAVGGVAANGATGVAGVSDTGVGVTGNSNGVFGVHGNCQNDAGVGVMGDGSYGAVGVYGHSGRGIAVKGVANEGVGIYGLGLSVGGTGVHAEAGAGAAALVADGPSRFSGTTTFSRSGQVTVAAGGRSATVSGLVVAASTLVLATLQQDRDGVAVQSAVRNVAGGSIKITLTQAVTTSTKVAWFLLG